MFCLLINENVLHHLKTHFPELLPTIFDKKQVVFENYTETIPLLQSSWQDGFSIPNVKFDSQYGQIFRWILCCGTLWWLQERQWDNLSPYFQASLLFSNAQNVEHRQLNLWAFTFQPISGLNEDQGRCRFNGDLQSLVIFTETWQQIFPPQKLFPQQAIFVARTEPTPTTARTLYDSNFTYSHHSASTDSWFPQSTTSYPVGNKLYRIKIRIWKFSSCSQRAGRSKCWKTI